VRLIVSKRTPMIYLALMAWSKLAVPSVAQDAPINIPPALSGHLDISYHEKFLPSSGPILAAATPESGYISLRYSIGLPSDRQYIEQVLQYLSQIFPETFGNSSGTYTVTISVADLNGKLIVKNPILSFQWTKESGFLFIEKTVSQIQQTTWKGTLVSEMLLRPETSRLKVSVEVYSQADRSLDFQLLKKTSATFSSGALASYFPLPAATAPFLDAMTDLINDVYANSKKADLIDGEEIVMARTKAPIKSTINISGAQNSYRIPIYLYVDVQDSRIINGDLEGGKFGPDQISTSIFNTLAISMGDGKSVSIVELISSSADNSIKTARPLLDGVIAGGSYGKDPNNKKENDIAARCGSLYDALNLYLSRYDARAMFYAFVTNYGDRIDKEACLGPRKVELESVGLQP
jgi:hypothetical protein